MSSTPIPSVEFPSTFILSFLSQQKEAHAISVDHGFWANPRNKGESFALIHSEISEALEGTRKNLMDDHLPARPMEEVELADAVIRIMDHSAGFGLDVAGAIVEKMAYNAKRPYLHGKRF